MPDIHQTLSSMLAASKFEPYIRYIRFPYFRNLRPGLRIEFDHPITALVGPNGTNKTAILRALQGCPDYYDVGQYWYSTSLDPIGLGERHRFIHGYYAKSEGKIVEVIKSRIQRGANPDYFEPSRPILSDSMERMPPLEDGAKVPADRAATRWKAIQKNVVYLDFRSELSAYDKYFFHVPFTKALPGMLGRKNSIRRRSAPLRSSLYSGRKKHIYYGRERIIKPAKDATKEQTAAISAILGRSYNRVRIMDHRYFDVVGSSIILDSLGRRYSEAFAGSGEFAVAKLVFAVTEAEPNSLILLDEPEVSLHPGAQARLMAFLAEHAKAFRHQIVISTHSPEIVRNLPAAAIKVFDVNLADHTVDLLSQSSHPSEAFFKLGMPVTDHKTIFVEDKLAKAIISAAIRPLGEARNAKLEIKVIPGGAGSIATRFIPGFALAKYEDCLVILDGDQRPDLPIPKIDTVANADLEQVLQRTLNGSPLLSLNGAGGTSTPGERVGQYREVLDWIFYHVNYLPGDTPEALLVQMTASELPADKTDKVNWVEKTITSLGRPSWESVTAEEILGEQERWLAKISPDVPEMRQIRDVVVKFLNG
jgi:hypothetical protein